MVDMMGRNGGVLEVVMELDYISFVHMESDPRKLLFPDNSLIPPSLS